MLFTRVFLASTLALFASADTTDNGVAIPTSFTPAQATRVLNDLAAYATSVEAQPEYSSAIAAFQSAIPSSVLAQIDADPSEYIQSVVSATATPAWISAVPSGAIQYFSSVVNAEASIIKNDVKGPAPTNAVKVVGAVMAAGGAALALL